ncbi:hypothetical protein ASD60_06600 [Pseudomonas sp. Root562]|nr:hypothetical protein ASD60_06600 [Pseudomonas sp. Root562]
MGATHLLTRKLAAVSAEMSLDVLAYNLKRVMKIIGPRHLMKALTAWADYCLSQTERICLPDLKTNDLFLFSNDH